MHIFKEEERKRKKILAMLLVLCMIMSMVACTGPNTTDPTTGKTVEIGSEKNGGLLITYGSPADGEITLTVAEGDEIAFIINRNGSNAFDATDTSVTLAYQ